MPRIDLPLAELLAYTGRNPCPADFDDYWRAGLAEISEIEPHIELIPANFDSSIASCFDLWFTGTLGARVHAKYLRPRSSNNRRTCVLQFHGFNNHSGEWHEKLGLVAEGCCVAALDCRGQGGLSQDHGTLRSSPPNGHLTRGLLDADPRNLLYRHLYLDTALLARIVSSFDEVDPEQLVATGNSQGGGLTLACAALVPSIRRIALKFPFLCDWQRVWEMDQAQDAYAELRDFFRRFDPCHERAADIWLRLGYIDAAHLAPRIRAAVLMGVGLMDTICPPSSQFAAYNRITSAKQLAIYPDFGHESLPGFMDRAHRFLIDG
jgi:cephalosporin-C deacetylase